MVISYTVQQVYHSNTRVGRNNLTIYTMISTLSKGRFSNNILYTIVGFFKQ